MSTKDSVNGRNLAVDILEGNDVDIFYHHLENAFKNNKRSCYVGKYDKDDCS